MKTIRLNKLINKGITKEDFPGVNPNEKIIIGTREEILDTYNEQELEIALRTLKFRKACEAMDKAIAMFDIPVHVLYGDEALYYLEEKSH